MERWFQTSRVTQGKTPFIGWEKLGNLSALEPTRDHFKAKYIQAYPTEKPGALPVKAGLLFRFAVDRGR